MIFSIPCSIWNRFFFTASVPSKSQFAGDPQATYRDVGRYDCMDAGGSPRQEPAVESNAGAVAGMWEGTTAWMQEVARVRNQRSRATQGAVAGKTLLSPGSETKLGKL